MGKMYVGMGQTISLHFVNKCLQSHITSLYFHSRKNILLAHTTSQLQLDSTLEEKTHYAHVYTVSREPAPLRMASTIL